MQQGRPYSAYKTLTCMCWAHFDADPSAATHTLSFLGYFDNRRNFHFYCIQRPTDEMCFKKENLQTAIKVKSPRSPWRQMIRQPTKPRLSRKVIRSARVNLNRYWNKFEEMAANKVPLTFMATADCTFLSSTDNEINENILNEWREVGN